MHMSISARTVIRISLALLITGFLLGCVGSIGEGIASLGGPANLPPPGTKVVVVQEVRLGSSRIQLDPTYAVVLDAVVLATLIVTGLAAYRRQAWARWPFLLSVLVAAFPGPFPITNVWRAVQLAGDLLMLLAAALLLLPQARSWFSRSRDAS
jgi:hypothetical protein